MKNELCLGGNLLVLSLFRGEQEDASPYMHAIHFCYAAGALLAPLISAPFLQSRNDGQINTNSTKMEDAFKTERGHIGIPFLVTGVAAFFTSLGFIYYSKKLKIKQDFKMLNDAGEEQEQHNAKESSNCSMNVTVALFCLFSFLYVGAEFNYGAYATAFGVNSHLGLSKAEGAMAAAAYWAGFTIMRLLAVPASIWINSQITMIVNR